MTSLTRSVRGSSGDTVRRHNLSVVLTLVHERRSVSRSRLTLETGLNRSTIAALVAELTDLGFVREVQPETTTRVGRPSPLVQPSDRVVGIAVNPEVDAITVAAVGLGGTVTHKVRHELRVTPSASHAVAIASAEIASLLATLGPDAIVTGIGIAVPGLVSARDGVVRLAPHLTWTDVPLAGLLRRATGLRVEAANDAGLGANAEHLFGAGVGVADMIYLNGGASGIGGGIISAGKPLTGANGFAGEFGHTRTTSKSDRDRSGAPGSLELEVSRRSVMNALGITSVDGLDAALAESRDPAVQAEVRRQLDALAVVISNAVDILNPSLVVLGGFLGALHEALPGYLDAVVARDSLAVSGDEVRISRARLGGDILFIGAAELAFGPLLFDPAGWRANE